MENVKKELCCKLCLGDGFQVIDSTEKVALSGLNLNLDIADTDVICSDCSENLSAAFNFKLMCLETEENIYSYIYSANNLVDIKEIYVQVKDDKKLIDMLEDPKICRLCLQLVTCEFKSVYEVDLDTVREYIPEINFVSVVDPILCKICFDSLCNHSTFLKNCLNQKDDAKNAQLRIKECYVEIERLEIKSEECEMIFEEDEQRKPDNTVLVSKRKNNQATNNRKKKGSYGTTGKNDLDRHNKTRKKRERKCEVFTCDVCGYEAKYECTIKVHRAIHSNEKPYICGECGYRTRRRGNLNAHMKRHVKEEPSSDEYSCKLCPFKTKTIKRLTVHHRLSHEEPTELFECHVCGLLSRYKSTLVKHALIHRGDEAKIYKCDKCPFQTMHKGSLRNHGILHLKPEEIKLYKCDLCYFTTKKKCGLRRHLLTHRDPSKLQRFECATCGYKTPVKGLLKAHVLIHLDAFIKCDLCSFTCKQNYLLTRHIRIHHKDKKAKLTTPECSSTV